MIKTIQDKSLYKKLILYKNKSLDQKKASKQKGERVPNKNYHNKKVDRSFDKNVARSLPEKTNTHAGTTLWGNCVESASYPASLPRRCTCVLNIAP